MKKLTIGCIETGHKEHYYAFPDNVGTHVLFICVMAFAGIGFGEFVSAIL